MGRLSFMSLGARIKTARTDAKLTLATLGQACGVSPQAVKAWEDGRSEPGVASIVAISRATATPLDFLLTGNAQSRPGLSTHLIGEGRLVPRRKWPLPGQTTDAVEQEQVFVTSQFPCGPRAFSVLVQDASNAPAIAQGDSLIIDPDIRPKPGDMIMTLCGDEVVLRRYRPRSDCIELAPINDDWPVQTIPALNGNLIGTMTEHTKPRR